MGNFWKSAIVNRTILLSTICAFTFASITPLYAAPANGVSLSIKDVNFGIKIEKLIEKTKKHYNAKNSEKLIDVMFDIKHEIESYTGQKIDIEKALKQVEKEANSNGYKIDKKEMKALKERYLKQEKRLNHKAVYIAECIELQKDYDSNEESFLYESTLTDSWVYLKSKDNKEKNEDGKEEGVLPLRVTIGVTLALVGIFLYVVPFPVCNAAAPWAIETGVALLADQAITEWENSEKDKEDHRGIINV